MERLGIRIPLRARNPPETYSGPHSRSGFHSPMYALNPTLLKDLENVYVAIASARLRGGKGDPTPTVYQKLALVPSQRLGRWHA